MKTRTWLPLAVAGLLSLWCPAPVAPSAQARTPDVFAFVRALDDASSKTLWPEFNPSSLPIALFDGENTILLRHPSPPPEFSPMPGHPGVLIAPGRQPSVVSNSTRDIGGVRTATVIATPAQSIESTSLAVMEEVFHVFWLARHPSFRPDEMTRYGYPVSDADNLQRLFAEDEALARALAAGDAEDAWRWAARALEIRRARTPALTDEVRVFETSMEMMEGTANYVARRAVGESPAHTADRLRVPRAAEAIRWRFYDSGAALCFVAERLLPGWRERLEGERTLTVAEMLAVALGERQQAPAVFTNADTNAFRARAAEAIADLAGRQQRLRADLLGRRGSRIVIDVAPGVDAFHLQRFDPINLMVLDGGEVAHPHFVSLTDPHGTIELTNPGYARESYAGTVGLTVSAGRHPLRDGIRQLTIVGIEGTPKIGRDGDTVTLDAPGIRLTLHGVDVRVEGDWVRITVRTSTTAPSRAGPGRGN
jgi:hypothetical protein